MASKEGIEREEKTLPQSMRHQRILDLAAKQPHASMESIAEDVPSATVELVEHILEEYGDPADNDTTEPITADDVKPDRQPPTSSIDTEDARLEPNGGNVASLDQEQEDDGDSKPDQSDGEDTAGDGEQSLHEDSDEETNDSGLKQTFTEDSDAHGNTSVHELPSGNELTDGQREVLRVVAERPDATQREIADRIGVSAPTVSNRVNAIEGFDWQHRKQAVETFRSTESDPMSPQTSMSTNETEPTGEMDRLEERIDTLESKIASDQTSTNQSLNLDPELLHKVVHACLKSETISEDEELELLKLFFPKHN